MKNLQDLLANLELDDEELESEELENEPNPLDEARLIVDEEANPPEEEEFQGMIPTDELEEALLSVTQDMSREELVKMVLGMAIEMMWLKIKAGEVPEELRSLSELLNASQSGGKPSTNE